MPIFYLNQVPGSWIEATFYSPYLCCYYLHYNLWCGKPNNVRIGWTVNTFNEILVIRLKGIKYGVCVTKLPKQSNETVANYLLLGFPSSVRYTVSAQNMFELLYKINHNYKLITPDTIQVAWLELRKKLSQLLHFYNLFIPEKQL